MDEMLEIAFGLSRPGGLAGPSIDAHSAIADIQVKNADPFGPARPRQTVRQCEDVR